MAATAAGKTEAAIAPLLERHLLPAASATVALAGTSARSSRQDETDLRILYISPTRALVRDLYERLRLPLESLGVSLAMKSGDTGPLSRLPHVLITTPESTDSLLTRTARSFTRLQAVVHRRDPPLRRRPTRRSRALSAQPHRDHPRLLLSADAGRCDPPPLQRVALSATVPDPTGVASRYLTADEREPAIVEVAGGRALDAEIFPAPDLEDVAQALLWRAWGDPPARKSLLFCNTRREVEQTAAYLRAEPRLRGGDLRPLLQPGSGHAPHGGGGFRPGGHGHLRLHIDVGTGHRHRQHRRRGVGGTAAVAWLVLAAHRPRQSAQQREPRALSGARCRWRRFSFRHWLSWPADRRRRSSAGKAAANLKADQRKADPVHSRDPARNHLPAIGPDPAGLQPAQAESDRQRAPGRSAPRLAGRSGRRHAARRSWTNWRSRTFCAADDPTNGGPAPSWICCSTPTRSTATSARIRCRSWSWTPTADARWRAWSAPRCAGRRCNWAVERGPWPGVIATASACAWAARASPTSRSRQATAPMTVSLEMGQAVAAHFGIALPTLPLIQDIQGTWVCHFWGDLYGRWLAAMLQGEHATSAAHVEVVNEHVLYVHGRIRRLPPWDEAAGPASSARAGPGAIPYLNLGRFHSLLPPTLAWQTVLDACDMARFERLYREHGWSRCQARSSESCVIYCSPSERREKSSWFGHIDRASSVVRWKCRELVLGFCTHNHFEPSQIISWLGRLSAAAVRQTGRGSFLPFEWTLHPTKKGPTCKPVPSCSVHCVMMNSAI